MAKLKFGDTSSCPAMYKAQETSGYQLRRVKDDNNNEIGTAFMEFEDGNGNRYDVVCLDAQYRKSSAKWYSSAALVTNLPIYNTNVDLWWYDNAKETATQNTQIILDSGTTSDACSYCRSQSFTIGGVTYYGQLPNMREVFEIWKHRVQIETMDTSATSQSSTNFSKARSIWSSTQYSNTHSWYLVMSGQINGVNKTYGYQACPVLEIPV